MGTVLKNNEAADVLTWKNVYNRTLEERRWQVFKLTLNDPFLFKRNKNHTDVCHT